jgi:hypothetical protein
MTELERLERETQSQPRTPKDYDAARRKAASHPQYLDALDVATLAHFGSDAEANAARAARDAARTAFASRSGDEQLASIVVDALRTALTPIAGRMQEQHTTIATLEKRVALLEVTQVHDRGVWEVGKSYPVGAIVTHAGSGWICRSAHVSAGTEPDHAAFRLVVKRAARR